MERNVRIHGAVMLALWLLGGVATTAGAVEDGDPAPDFTALSLVEGETVKLSEYRGKVVYLDFWASWCPPCLTSLPQFNQLSEEFPASQFQMLAVNVDENPDKARKFLRKHPVRYPSAMDPKAKLPEKFGLKTMPTSYLIDRKGVVRYVHKGFRRGDLDRIRSEIQKVLEGRSE